MELNVNIFETKQIVDEIMKRGGGGGRVSNVFCRKCRWYGLSAILYWTWNISIHTENSCLSFKSYFFCSICCFKEDGKSIVVFNTRDYIRYCILETFVDVKGCKFFLFYDPRI